MAGPLAGVRIIEFAGIGPGPFCGMMLADHGADVIRIERPGQRTSSHDVLLRSRRSIALDTKTEAGREVALALCKSADGLIEGYRPGVMERLGLGPDVLLEANPKLVYGRMTGWGQTGPLAQAAGHDINYIAVSGVLHTVGEKGGKPIAPVNYIGDFAGGGMMLAYGMVCAILAVKMGGAGQVMDCAMTEGSAMIAAMQWSMLNRGAMRDERGVNLLDGGAHFYDTYECADGRHIALGAIEPQFYATFRKLAGLEADSAFDPQMDETHWPALKDRLVALFRTRTRDDWAALLEGTDACFAAVQSLTEAPGHPHNVARGSYIRVGGDIQPAPAPRYSQTQTAAPQLAGKAGADGEAILIEIGYDAARIAALKSKGALGA
jgi:alpha-methylacyl-CoA racemase